MNRDEIVRHAFGFKFGGMTSGELTFLYDQCIDKDVLELGSFVGMSSYVIASVAKQVHCVDLWSDNQDHLSDDPKQQQVYKNLSESIPNIFESFWDNCRSFIVSNKIRMVQGDTRNVYKIYKDNTFDVLVIDADHSYEGAKRDFELYHTKVKKDGIIIFHDYEDSMWTGISLFVNELWDKGIIIPAGKHERIFTCKLAKTEV